MAREDHFTNSEVDAARYDEDHFAWEWDDHDEGDVR